MERKRKPITKEAQAPQGAPDWLQCTPQLRGIQLTPDQIDAMENTAPDEVPQPAA